MIRERERGTYNLNRTDIRVMKKIYIYQTRNITVEEEKGEK